MFYDVKIKYSISLINAYLLVDNKAIYFKSRIIISPWACVDGKGMSRFL